MSDKRKDKTFFLIFRGFHDWSLRILFVTHRNPVLCNV